MIKRKKRHYNILKCTQIYILIFLLSITVFLSVRDELKDTFQEYFVKKDSSEIQKQEDDGVEEMSMEKRSKEALTTAMSTQEAETEITSFMAEETSSVTEAMLETQILETFVDQTEVSVQADEVEQYLAQMGTEDKVAQLFIIVPEVYSDSAVVTAVDDTIKSKFQSIPVGGFLFMEQNLISAAQTQTMLSELQSISIKRIGFPVFTSVDEEGGTVARIGGSGRFGVPVVGNMCDIGAVGDYNEAYIVGATIGTYLSNLGFNVDFAPVADVWNNSNNQVVKYRSFGSDPNMVADMAVSVLNGLQDCGVQGTFKHFPGHGATEADTHQGYAYTNKNLEELSVCELIPFQSGIAADVPFIMVGHISLPNVTGSDVPASMSSTIITQVLRNQMGYNGIVITDAMNMGAITQNYDSSEAAIQAILAGVDIVLMPADFNIAYQGVLNAVYNERISYERLNESVRRIIKMKLKLMF